MTSRFMEILHCIILVAILEAVKSNTTQLTLNITTPTASTWKNNLTDVVSTTANTKCAGKNAWNIDVFSNHAKCLTKECTEKAFDTFELFIACNDYKRAEEAQLIGSFTSKYALLRSAIIKNENLGLLNGRHYTVAKREHFSIEYGYLRKSMLHLSQPLNFDGHGNSINFPATELVDEYTQYQFAVFKDVYKVQNNIRYAVEETPLRQSLAKLTSADDENPVTLQLNSDIVSFSLFPEKAVKKYGDFIEIKFLFRDFAGTLNHQCIRITDLGSGRWTNGGCHEYETTDFYMVCHCDVIVGSYAVLSEVAATNPVPAASGSGSITTLVNIICYIGLASSISCILLPYILRCSHLGGMLRVYFFADLTLAVECITLLIGVSKSEDPSSAQLIAVVLHILQHSMMLWAMIEGIHIYHGISPLYSEAAGMTFFYTSLAYGVPAALAGAGAGFDFKFTGKTQYIWPKASGLALTYFVLPTIIIIIFLAAFCGILVYELLAWIGTKSDYLYKRSVLFLKRNIGLVLVLAVTHMMGLSSMASGGTGFYVYLFLAFFGIQILMLFYFHFASNYEIWEWKAVRDFEKELERQNQLSENDEYKGGEEQRVDAKNKTDDKNEETTFTLNPNPDQSEPQQNSSKFRSKTPSLDGIDNDEIRLYTPTSSTGSSGSLIKKEKDMADESERIPSGKLHHSDKKNSRPNTKISGHFQSSFSNRSRPSSQALIKKEGEERHTPDVTERTVSSISHHSAKGEIKTSSKTSILSRSSFLNRSRPSSQALFEEEKYVTDEIQRNASSKSKHSVQKDIRPKSGISNHLPSPSRHRVLSASSADKPESTTIELPQSDQGTEKLQDDESPRDERTNSAVSVRSTVDEHALLV